MIHVIATIELAPGGREAFADEFRRLAPLVRAEDGCIEYSGAVDIRTSIAAQAAVRDDSFTVIERWDSEPALAAHLDAVHMHDHRERVRDLATKTIIHVLRPV
ncbi:MAG: putative quinol monooxygenase [Gemmatimonadaceae bacterium]